MPLAVKVVPVQVWCRPGPGLYQEAVPVILGPLAARTGADGGGFGKVAGGGVRLACGAAAGCVAQAESRQAASREMAKTGAKRERLCRAAPQGVWMVTTMQGLWDKNEAFAWQTALGRYVGPETAWRSGWLYGTAFYLFWQQA